MFQVLALADNFKTLEKTCPRRVILEKVNITIEFVVPISLGTKFQSKKTILNF